MSEIPARFEVGNGGGGAVLRCTRPGCDWWEMISRQPLTEVVALAQEHVEEAHRSRTPDGYAGGVSPSGSG